MAIIFKTKEPNKLLSYFKKAIDDHKIETWLYDKDGDFTHTPNQWKNRAWLRPEIRTGELVFSMVKPKTINITSLVYAVYHGRFIESMLNHCDSLFDNATASAFPSEKDRVS